MIMNRRSHTGCIIWPSLVALATLSVGIAIAHASPASAVAGLQRTQSPAAAPSTTSFKTRIASCPSGTVVIGGGGGIYNAPAAQVRLTSLQPVHSTSGDRFEVRAETATGFVGPWSLLAYAICANRLPGYEIRSGTTTLSSSTFKATSAACPSGKRVIGTGASVLNSSGQFTGVNQVGLQLVRAAGPLDIARGTAREDANGYSGSWQVRSFAVCVNTLAGAAVAGQLVSGSGGTASCTSGRVHGAGGGGSLTDSGPYFLRAVIPSSNLSSVTTSMTGVPVGGTGIQAICAP